MTGFCYKMYKIYVKKKIIYKFIFEIQSKAVLSRKRRGIYKKIDQDNKL